MTYTKEKFETFLAGLKKKERQNLVMKKRLELKKRIAGTRGRNKYYRGEFVGLLSPDNTPYRYGDLKRESIVEIFDEIIANMG